MQNNPAKREGCERGQASGLGQSDGDAVQREECDKCFDRGSVSQIQQHNVGRQPENPPQTQVVLCMLCESFVAEPEERQACCDNDARGNEKRKQPFSACNDEYEWPEREARRAGGAVHADNASAPLLIGKFVDQRLAGGPQKRRSRAEQE